MKTITRMRSALWFGLAPVAVLGVGNLHSATLADGDTPNYDDIETVEVVGQALVRVEEGTGNAVSIVLAPNTLTPACPA